MFDFERFLEEKMNPLYRAHYAIWVHWWPVWRSITLKNILKYWEKCDLVKDGNIFLDYGCGTGDFSFQAASRVSEEGKVFALDYFPRQLEIVQAKAEKAGLDNIETILSDRDTGLPDESVDVVWMCDVLHEIKERRRVLKEMHRVLKDDGVLAIHDGMRERTLAYTANLFQLSQKGDKFLTFDKIS